MHRAVAFVVVALAVALAVGYRVWTAEQAADLNREPEATAVAAEPNRQPVSPPEPVPAGDATARPLSSETPTETGRSDAPLRPPRTDNEDFVRIEGVVVERETSLPVAGAVVAAYESADWMSADDFELPGGMESEVLSGFLGDDLEMEDFEPAPWDVMDEFGEPLTETIAGPDGRFSIAIEPSKSAFLQCKAEGFAMAHERVRSADDSLRITLQRAGTVRGRVVDARNGAPLAEIDVSVSPRRSFDASMNWFGNGPHFGGANSAVTNDRGEYEIAGVAIGAYRVIADGQSQGYLPQSEAGAIVNVEAGGDHVALEIRLERGGFVFGEVTDETGLPIEFASFDVEEKDANDFANAFDFDAPSVGGWSEVDENGAFRLGALEYEVDYRIEVSASGYAPVTQSVRLSAGRDEGPLSFVLKNGGSISGVVLYEDGKPALDTYVSLSDADSSEFDWQSDGASYSAPSIEGNTFRFSDVPDGRYRVTAMSSDGMGVFVDSDGVEVEVADAQHVSGVEVVVSRGPQDSKEPITGIVVDAAGKPVADIEVQLFEVSEFPDDSTKTDAAGKFSLTPTPMFSGSFTVEASGDAGYKRLTGVQPGSAVRLRLGPVSIVSGIVVNQRGEPVADCSVSLERNATNFMDAIPFGGGDSATTGPDGAFEFSNMKPGKYYVQARTQTLGTGKSDEFNMDEGDTLENVRVTLEPGARVAGRVLDPDRRPLGRAQVKLMPAESGLMGAMADMMPEEFSGTGGAATTDDRGEFEIPNVPPGNYTAVATYPQYAKASVPNIALESGDDLQGLDLIMSTGGGASGVYMKNGQPKGGVTIQLVGTGGMHTVTTDANGWFDVTGMPPGRYMVMPMDFDDVDMSSNNATGFGGMFPQSVDIVEGQVTPIDFTPPDGVAVSGSIAALGLGEGAMVRLRDPDGVSLNDLDMSDPISTGLEMIAATSGFGEVAADGQFIIENVEPGSYVLEVYQEPDPSSIDPSGDVNFDMMQAFMPVLVHSQPVSVGAEPIAVQIGTQPPVN